MVSRQETSRPLLTPGEVMQLPADEELVLVSGVPPIRARKLRYFEDRNFVSRVLPPPVLGQHGYADGPPARPHDWSGVTSGIHSGLRRGEGGASGAGGQDLQQARQPSFQPRRRRRDPEPAQLDLLDIAQEDGDVAAEARFGSALVPVARAYGLDVGSGRDEEPIPGF
jgi:type IV secretion system protein VirD4